MLLEALVVTVCLQGSGCSESSRAYYLQNPELQEFVKSAENTGKRLVNNNKWIVYAATPVYAMVSGQTAQFHIYKTWSLEMNMRSQVVGIRWTY